MLADYRSDVLSASKQRAVRMHLAECEECSNELMALDDVLALVETYSEQCEPPAGLWNGVRNRIEAGNAKRQGFGATLRDWLARPVHAAGTAALAAALAVVIALSGGPVHQPTAVPMANEYVQGHALYAGQAPLADRPGYLSLVAASADRGTEQ